MEAQQISKERVLALLLQGSTSLDNMKRSQCMDALQLMNTSNSLQLLRVLLDLLLHQSMQVHLIAFGYLLRVWIPSNRVRGIQPQLRKAYLCNANAHTNTNAHALELYGSDIVKLVGQYFGVPVSRRWLQQMIKQIPQQLPVHNHDLTLIRYFSAVLSTIQSNRYPPLITIRADYMLRICSIALNRQSICQLQFFIMYCGFIAMIPASFKEIIIKEIPQMGRVGSMAVKTTLKFIQSTSASNTTSRVYSLALANAVKKLSFYLSVDNKKLNEEDQQEMEALLKLIQLSLSAAIKETKPGMSTQMSITNTMHTNQQINSNAQMRELADCLISLLSSISLKVSSQLYAPSPSLLSAMVNVLASIIENYKSISNAHMDTINTTTNANTTTTTTTNTNTCPDLLQLISNTFSNQTGLGTNVGLLWLMCGLNRQILQQLRIQQIISGIINKPTHLQQSTVYFHLIKHYLTAYYYIPLPMLMQIIIYLHQQINILASTNNSQTTSTTTSSTSTTSSSTHAGYRIGLALTIFPKVRKFSELFQLQEMAGMIAFVVKACLEMLMMDTIDSQVIALIQTTLKELTNGGQIAKPISLHCQSEVFSHISHLIIKVSQMGEFNSHNHYKNNINTNQRQRHYYYVMDLLLSIFTGDELVQFGVICMQSISTIMQVIRCIYHVKGYEERLYNLIRNAVMKIGFKERSKSPMGQTQTALDGRCPAFLDGLPKDLPRILLPILIDIFQDTINKYQYNEEGLLIKSKNHSSQIILLIDQISFVVDSLSLRKEWKSISIISDHLQHIRKNIIDINNDQIIIQSFKSIIRDALLNLEVNNLSIQ